MIPYGTCHCGCGERTNPAQKTSARAGWVKGEPVKFLNGHGRRKSGVEYIEQDRGHDTPCWVWQLSTAGKGYGFKWHDGRRDYAHRVYYERHRGPIPAGLYIDHLCRVPACVNPDHLEPVTVATNAHRGLQPKLTREKARAIRRSTQPAAVLASRYGVGERAIRNVRKGMTWREA